MIRSDPIDAPGGSLCLTGTFGHLNFLQSGKGTRISELRYILRYQTRTRHSETTIIYCRSLARPSLGVSRHTACRRLVPRRRHFWLPKMGSAIPAHFECTGALRIRPSHQLRPAGSRHCCEPLALARMGENIGDFSFNRPTLELRAPGLFPPSLSFSARPRPAPRRPRTATLRILLRDSHAFKYLVAHFFHASQCSVPIPLMTKQVLKRVGSQRRKCRS